MMSNTTIQFDADEALGTIRALRAEKDQLKAELAEALAVLEDFWNEPGDCPDIAVCNRVEAVLAKVTR